MTLSETSSSDAAGRSPPDEATLQKIRERAHQIWESNGRPVGRDAEHWKIAEEEILSRVELPDQDDTRPPPPDRPSDRPVPPAAAAPARDLGPPGAAEAGPRFAAQPVPGPGPAPTPEAGPEPRTEATPAVPAAGRADGAADQAEDGTAPPHGAMAPAVAPTPAPAREQPAADGAPVRVRRAGAAAAARNGSGGTGGAGNGSAPNGTNGTAPGRSAATVVPLRAAATGLPVLAWTAGGAMQGGMVLAFGLPALWLEGLEWSHRALERNAREAGALIRCRSADDLVTAQRALLAGTVEDLLEESGRLFELSARIARDALEAMRGEVRRP